MASERELKTLQENALFDLLYLNDASESERVRTLKKLIARAQSGMTAEEISNVKERVAHALSE